MWELTQQCRLRLGNLVSVQVRDRSGFEVLPDGLFHERTHVATLPRGESSELFLHAAR
jgi:hypothetical protein